MQLHRAVNDAEATCGLQFCVVICGGPGALGEQVAAAFADLGIAEPPAVLLAIGAADGRAEVSVGSGARDRLSSRDVAEVLEVCALSDGEGVRERAAAIILTLADRAGPGVADADAPHHPDVITT